MAKYFMGGTRLEGLEHLMMDPSRSTYPPPPINPCQKGHCQKTKPDQPANRSVEQRGGESK